MTEIGRLVDQMRRAFDGDAWHGPALGQVLDGVDATLAASRPVPHVHSIWEIVLHLSATQRLLLRRLAGDGTALELPPDQDWPPVTDASAASWAATCRLLRNQEHALWSAAEALSDSHLDRPLIAAGSSAYTTLHGHVQHTLYHTGQINLLKHAVLRASGEC